MQARILGSQEYGKYPVFDFCLGVVDSINLNAEGACLEVKGCDRGGADRTSVLLQPPSFRGSTTKLSAAKP
jgi:hypothetical protein